MKAFEQRLKKTGVAPPPLLARPKLRAHDLRYLSAFRMLSRSRQRSMEGPQPLTLAEMQAYFDMFGVREAATRRRYVGVVQALDEVFLVHVAEDMARRRKQAEK